MRIGFFLENKYYSEVDFSHPEQGNPGIRGTQYMMWIIACRMSNAFDVYMFAPCISKMPNYLICNSCEDESQAIEKAQQLGVEILVLRAKNDKASFYRDMHCGGLKIVLWSHNFEDYDMLNAVSYNQQIKRLVCVGRQQYERLRDHSVFNKSTYIYNALDLSLFSNDRFYNQKVVTYIGALNELKGFHILAKAWKKISKKVPEAELYVLGAGNLGKNSELGVYGLANKKYEKKFIKYLVDKDGDILTNVHFMGSIGGIDKDRIIINTSVGVANPTGIGETFCIVATEFEAFGVPVVSKKGYGLLDSVINRKTGILINNVKELTDAIVLLLLDKDLNIELGKNGKKYVKENFNLDIIAKQWVALFEDVNNDKEQEVRFDYNFPNNQNKRLREINRNIQRIGLKVPSLLMFEYVKPFLLKNIVKLKNLIVKIIT